LVKSVRIAFVEWLSRRYRRTARSGISFKDSITAVRQEILVTNEPLFGPWLADSAAFSQEKAHFSVHTHEKGLEGLIDLGLPAVISSRPVWNKTRSVHR
jgi:N-carbamoylputrescine amidase